MTTPQPEKLYCANHPDRETYLRCNRCEKPICVECAVLTPTGYRCKECVRMQQKIFETAKTQDYVLAFIISGVLSYLGSLVVGFAGFFSLLLAPFVGIIIAEAVRKVTGKRRSKTLFRVASISAALGACVTLLPYILVMLLGLSGLETLIAMIWPVIYAVIVSTSVYTRLSGIQILK